MMLSLVGEDGSLKKTSLWFNLPHRKGFYMEGFTPKRSALQPSPILSWFEENSKLRAQGKMNELDTNEIKCALKGVQNKWSERVQKDEKLFQNLVNALEGCDENKATASKIWTQMMS